MRRIFGIILWCFSLSAWAIECDTQRLRQSAATASQLTLQCHQVGGMTQTYLSYACAKFRGKPLGQILNDRRFPAGVISAQALAKIPRWAQQYMRLEGCQLSAASSQATIQFRHTGLVQR